MTTIKRIIAALIASMVIFITTYNTYDVNVNAAAVVGGATLGELLAEFLLSVGVSYVGYETLQEMTGSNLQSELHLYLNTTEGSSALKDFAKEMPEFTVIEGGGGSAPQPPEDPNEIINTKVDGLILTQELYNLASGFYDYAMDPTNGSDLGAAINDAADQDVFFVNPALPEGVYIGFNSTLIPGYAAMDGFDASLAHIQYYDTNTKTYQMVQTSVNTVTDRTGSTYSAPSIYRSATRSGTVNCSAYKITLSGGIQPGTLASSGYLFNAEGAAYYENASNVKCNFNLNNGNLYLAPTNDQSIFWYGMGDYYLIYPSGVVWDGATSTSPSGVTTAEGALQSVKPIVGKDLASYIKSIGDNMIDPDADPAVDPVVLSPQALEQIYNNVSNYYDQTVENYYSNPNYITENEYVTNVTNIYQQAAAENPVPDPSVPVSPSLGDLGDYKVTGLSDVFPFCIPFDMYDLLTILAADPKAISFDFTFDFGEVLGQYTINIDLSVFDPVLQVVRTMELLLYMYGLMLVTRNLIRG